jgi:hypothetical protein
MKGIGCASICPILTYFSIGVDASWEGLGEPVQGDRIQDVLVPRCLVGPFDEFLSNPVG